MALSDQYIENVQTACRTVAHIAERSPDDHRLDLAAALMRYLGEWVSQETMGRVISLTAHEFLDGLAARLESESRDEATALIVERTRLYRETWIVSPLQAVIDKVERR